MLLASVVALIVAGLLHARGTMQPGHAAFSRRQGLLDKILSGVVVGGGLGWGSVALVAEWLGYDLKSSYSFSLVMIGVGIACFVYIRRNPRN